MAQPIEDIHTFDLHIMVGTRSWPDDVEQYCEVTFPGLDAAHTITIDYMRFSGDSLGRAIERATADIQAYMLDPDAWTENYIKQHGSVQEKRRELELEIEEYERDLKGRQASIMGAQSIIETLKQRLQALDDK